MAGKLFCRNLTASYDEKKILNNVSIELSQGEFLCLCGLNGIGKSTLLSLLAGLPQPNLIVNDAEIYPSIVLDSTNDIIQVSKLSRKNCAKYISFMQQNEYSVWDFSVKDFILQGRYPYTKNGIYSKNDYEVVDSVINELSLNELKERNIHSLSGGEMQKIKIARALAQQPMFIILDEPSANLDIVFEPKLLQLLKDLTKKKNIGVLISIHDINITSEIADKICLLNKDGLISGKYDNIVNIENLKNTFGVDFECKEKKYFQLLQ